jgi:hypothetical protein
MPRNPYAFPQSIALGTGDSPVTSDDYSRGGMELRDYFAGQALIGVMVMRTAIREGGLANVDDISQESIAEEAYELADAMLEAREKEAEDA